MKLVVIETVEECEGLLDEWAGLCAPGASRIFTSPWWSIGAWRHFSDLGRPLLMTARSAAGQLQAALPLTSTRDGASWAGSPLGDEHDMLLHPDVDHVGVARELVAEARRMFGSLRLTEIRAGGVLATCGSVSRGCPAPLLPLQPSNPEFGTLACIPGWSRTRRRGLRSRRAMLEELGELRFERSETPQALSDIVPSFVAARLASWTARERLAELPTVDRHAQFPAFLVEATSGLASAGLCHIDRLILNDAPIAQALYFRLATSSLLYMSTYQMELARYSPSHLLLAESASAALDEGRTVIEMGRGDEPYKFDHGAIVNYLEDVDL